MESDVLEPGWMEVLAKQGKSLTVYRKNYQEGDVAARKIAARPLLREWLTLEGGQACPMECINYRIPKFL